MDRLSKLSTLEIDWMTGEEPRRDLVRFKNELQELNVLSDITCEYFFQLILLIYLIYSVRCTSLIIKIYVFGLATINHNYIYYLTKYFSKK